MNWKIVGSIIACCIFGIPVLSLWILSYAQIEYKLQYVSRLEKWEQPNVWKEEYRYYFENGFVETVRFTLDPLVIGGEYEVYYIYNYFGDKVDVEITYVG